MSTVNDHLTEHYEQMKRLGIDHLISDAVMLSHIFEIVDKQIIDKKAKARLNDAIFSELTRIKNTQVKG